MRNSERRHPPKADRTTLKRADATLTDELTFGVEAAIKRLAELSPDARAGADQAEPGAPAAAAVLSGALALRQSFGLERRHALGDGARGLGRARDEGARLGAAGVRKRRADARRRTKLAGPRGGPRDGVAEGERAIALVSVALGRPLDASAAIHVRRALAKARDGDAPLALTHLALAGAERPDDPREDARRLFIADGLMKAGVKPRAILEALGAPSTQSDLDRAYDPDQPRVPAGNGRPSGQWTSGDWEDETGEADDASTPAGAQNAATNSGTRGVQIADASDDWTQYLNPISPAEAAGGSAPYAQHQLEVAAGIAHYEALGYVIVSRNATAVNVPGFPSPRLYDFVVQSPDGVMIGVEVKTTLGDTIFLNPVQVAKDVAVMLTGRATAQVGGAPIRGGAYTTYCRACDKIDIRGAILYNLLKLANIPFSYDRLP